MITKEEFKRMKDAVRTYGRRRNFDKVQVDLMEDMIDMIFEEYTWAQIQENFSSSRVASWTRKQLVKAGIEGARLLTP